ncbi:hypothetical protein MNBD_GAMMA26-2648 [hydrothermal vent metagenome]|uniref:Death on curing protein, Doc toxin n=1 Tax=hydrothermal vent metagenome TaxID=652676 RepID=A0A3B1B5T3_9ZZZZ
MRKLLVTTPAQSDLSNIHSYTQEHYGFLGAKAYDVVLKQALLDLRDDPYRPGSKERPEIDGNIRSYHTSFSRERAGSGVKSPRHFVLYFLPHDDEVVISRILHDSCDLPRHIPVRHIKQAKKFTRNHSSKGKSHER